MTRTTDDKTMPAVHVRAVTRRQALARLGLGISIAYATPMLLGLREARADGGSGGGGSGGGNGGGQGSGPGGGSSNSGRSADSGGSHDGPSHAASPTSPSGPDDNSNGSNGGSSPGDDSIMFGQPSNS